MKVRDFMITKVFTVKPSNTVKELLNILHSNKIGGVPVIDDNGKLVGMISDGDILRYLAPKRMAMVGLMYMFDDGDIDDLLKEKLNTPIKHLMTKKNIVSISPDDTFESTIQILSKHHYKKLPVTNRAGRVVGVLSRGDIINNIYKKFNVS